MTIKCIYAMAAVVIAIQESCSFAEKWYLHVKLSYFTCVWIQCFSVAENSIRHWGLYDKMLFFTCESSNIRIQERITTILYLYLKDDIFTILHSV